MDNNNYPWNNTESGGNPQNPYAQNGYDQQPAPGGGNLYVTVDREPAQPFRPNKKLSRLLLIIAAAIEVVLIGALVLAMKLAPEQSESDAADAAQQEEIAEEAENADDDTPADGEDAEAEGEPADAEEEAGGEDAAAALPMPEGDGVSAEFEHHYDAANESGTVHGYDADGNEVWTYTSDTYGAAQLDRVSGLGENNGLYYLCEDNDIIALYITDGSVAWRAEDCAGSAEAIAFDEAGNAYITSYFGPDLTIVSLQGEVLTVQDEVNPQGIWAYDIAYSDGTITITYESGLMDFAAGGTYSVPASDYID